MASLPVPSPRWSSNAFHEGYLAAARSRRDGALRRMEVCPFPVGGRAAEVWHEGVAAWALDSAAGLVPTRWK